MALCLYDIGSENVPMKGNGTGDYSTVAALDTAQGSGSSTTVPALNAIR